MKKDGYYSSGEFARMAQVTLRTIRYYDKQNILKPSFVTESGTRFYTDEDFARLQQILLLKYLGFSLDDIREMTVADLDYHFLLDSLNVQLKLVRNKIEQMQMVEKAIQDTAQTIKEEHGMDWSKMLELIHLTNMEKSLKNQYQNASNISARINLHSLYCENKIGWFPWIFKQMKLKNGMKVLEIGCGDGTLWKSNREFLPKDIEITLTDISGGMLRDARRNVQSLNAKFMFAVMDAQELKYEKEQFDLVIANHVLFYCTDIEHVLRNVQWVLKPGGCFICSTYGQAHMWEVGQMVKEFDDRIVLSADDLFENFGKENGQEMLEKYFSSAEWIEYEDSLLVTESEPLISYILSCHGNQSQYIIERYNEFRSFVKRKIGKGLHVSKEAGIFICLK